MNSLRSEIPASRRTDANNAGSILKSMFPPSIRGTLRGALEGILDWIGVFAFRWELAAKRINVPRLLLYFGFSPGDDLLSTVVLRELRKRHRDRIFMVSNHRQLFIGNDDPSGVRPLWHRYSADASTVRICDRFAKLWGTGFIRLRYATLMMDGDRSTPPSRHIIAELCASVGITGPVAIRPYIHLTDAEQQRAAWASGCIVIQSSGMAARHPIRNKQWGEERFQAVVDTLAKEIEFIQLGGDVDPPIRGAKDLRGATSIRETAAILANARLFVGTVGFLMHVARAVECPSVIIFGGREAPWQSGYICNTNLYTAMPCAPCWQWNTCDFDRKCMTDIAPDDVVSAIRRMLEKPRGPLAVETIEI